MLSTTNGFHASFASWKLMPQPNDPEGGPSIAPKPEDGVPPPEESEGEISSEGQAEGGQAGTTAN